MKQRKEVGSSSLVLHTIPIAKAGIIFLITSALSWGRCNGADKGVVPARGEETSDTVPLTVSLGVVVGLE